jgi:integrase
MFRYAVEREHEFRLGENPVLGTRARKMESERSRVLTDDELKAIWIALNGLSEPGRSFVRVLMLTAVRRDEARGMRWAEADLEGALWVLPKDRNKSGRDFEIPLSKQMVALFKEILPGRLGPCVFTVNAKGEKPWGAHGPFKTDLDAKSGVTGWVFHDIRRTVRSRLAELRIPYEVAERVLNHAMTKIERTYNRHEYREQKAGALQAWADRLMLIVGEAGGTNIEMLRPTA